MKKPKKPAKMKLDPKKLTQAAITSEFEAGRVDGRATRSVGFDKKKGGTLLERARLVGFLLGCLECDAKELIK